MSKQHGTGCEFLDRRLKEEGISQSKIRDGARICLKECPYGEKCIIISKDADLKLQKRRRKVRQKIYVQCENCKTNETLTLTDNRLDKTQRFRKIGDDIYHMKNCGKCNWWIV